ncbi:hypothetical protein [Aureimonas sp. AU12]|uniref:hypothetical protein n=1 Tax=Aureimonas sp. AU12 TaxID=1638161 RepID=UPI00078291CD|nr:hypothetical protein [Aureimonas sp. AU12]
MSNRADRRATAKIAKQAVKRARTPTESGILRAAAAFAGEDLVGLLGPHLDADDFDDAWARLTPDLHDILEDRFGEFQAQAYAEAGLGTLDAAEAGERSIGMGVRLFLCPVVGAPDRLSRFAASPADLGRLAASLREFGVVPETGRCLVVPGLVPISAFAPSATTPGRVRALYRNLRARLIEPEGAPSGQGDAAGLSNLLGGRPEDAGAGAAFAALVGIELVPMGRAEGTEVPEEELDAEDMARAAALASWHDSYAAEVEGVAISAPLDWPACAAALAFETVLVPMEAARLARKLPDGNPDTIHTGLSDDGDRVLVSAVYGRVALGPFPAAAELVWFDADEFFGRAEASAGALIEHDSERGVMETLLARR